MLPNVDWRAWHEAYDDPNSGLSRRVALVQSMIRAALDRAPAGPIRVVSLCAGQGRDLLGVLADHPRRDDVRAVLVELDPQLAEQARGAARELPGVEVITGDAALTDHYARHVPAELVVLCGVLGNLTDADVQAMVSRCRALCAPGGTVVWTRHRREPDLVPSLLEWFTAEDFTVDQLRPTGVGAHVYRGRSQPWPAASRMFRFVR